MGKISEECKKKMTVLLASFRRETGKMVKSRGTGKGMYVCPTVTVTNKNVTEVFRNEKFS
jgi:acyl-CoA reductase-like NAD-dependent aldehyde dehydrogenase